MPKNSYDGTSGLYNRNILVLEAVSDIMLFQNIMSSQIPLSPYTGPFSEHCFTDFHIKYAHGYALLLFVCD